MNKFNFLWVFCLLGIIPLNEAIRCYHCYERYNNTIVSEKILTSEFDEKFVPCDKLHSKWNTWECPNHWPVCVIMSGTARNQYEIVRSCGERGFCANYVPPTSVEVETCRECENNLCNDFVKLPDPPVGPLFNFNININLRVKKYPLSDKEKESL